MLAGQSMDEADKAGWNSRSGAAALPDTNLAACRGEARPSVELCRSHLATSHRIGPQSRQCSVLA